MCSRYVNFCDGERKEKVDRRGLEARFWTRVSIRGADDCWLWTASRIGEGYGQFAVYRTRTSKIENYAHRVAWCLTHGSLDRNVMVLHKCDVRSCVNPGHLFLGTQLDNMRDAQAKGRLHVSRPSRHKVTDGQIDAMVDLRRAGVKLARIAAQFDVTKGFVSLVLSGKRRQYRRDADLQKAS